MALTNHQQLLDIIEFLPDATFVINNKKEVIAWNHALEEMTGVVKADILGKGDYAYSLPFWGQRRPIVIDLIGEECQEAEGNYCYVQRSGNVIFAEAFVPNLYAGRGAYVWVAASALLDENGNRYGAIESVRDITDKKLAEQQLLDIIEFLPDATFVINKEKEVIAWNRALEEMTGVVKADILGKGDYAYSIPFWGQRRPIVIDLIGSENKEVEDNYNYVQSSENVTFAEAFVPNLYGGRGAHVWVAASALLDKYGNRYGAIESVRDITDKKLVEAALRESERRFRVLTEASIAGIYILQEGVFCYVNPAMCKIFGYTESDLIGQWILDLVHPDHRSLVAGNLNRRLEGEGKEVRFEFHGIRKDGAVIWCEVLGTGIQYIDRPAIMGTLIDITERKRTEAALERSSTLLHNIIDSSTDYIYVKDRELRTILCNETFTQAQGKKPADMIGKTDIENGWDPELVKGNSAKGIRGWEADDRLALGGQTVHRIDDPGNVQGAIRFFDTIKLPLRDQGGKIIGLFGISRDITERRLAEQALQRSEAALKEAQRIAHLGSWELDVDQNEVRWSEELFRIFAWPLSEGPLPFGTVIEATHPDDRDRMTAAVEESLKTHGSFDLEYRIVRPDGSVRWIHTRGEVVLDESGKAVRGIGTALDITERKQAEDKVKESEKKFKSLTDTSPLAIYMSSGLEQKAEYVNTTFTKLFGYTLADVPTASDWWPLAYPDEKYRKQIVEEWQRKVAQAIKTNSAIEPMETVVTCKDDSKKNISWGFISTGVQDWSFGLDLTERKQAEEALRRSEEHLRLSQIYGGIGTWEADLITKEEYWSEAVITSLGFPALEKPTWDDFIETILPEDRQRVVDAIQSHLDCGAKLDVEYRILATDGRTRWMRSIGQAERDADGTPLRLRGIGQDITERKQAEEKLRLAASVFTHAREGIMFTDVNGAIIDVNEAFNDITGYSRDEVLGQNPRLLSSGLQNKEFYDTMWRDLVEKGHWHGEVWNRRKNGDVYPVMQTITAVRDDQGNTLQYMALYTDITLFKEHEQTLERSAHYDALTSLPNRVLLTDRLSQGMVQSRRREQQLAVVFLDLDGFKAINDNHGHESGDQLLITLATRMKQALRESDTLARLGGDEFVAVLPDIGDIEASLPMLTRLLAAAAEPVQSGDITLQVSASLGVTFYPQTEDIDADQLLRQADQAMYQAKQAGKNRYHLFDAEQDRSIRGRYESLEHIRQALAAGEFVLYYQPKVNMRAGKVTGAEALIRWQHPEKGLLLPDLFLPEIEDHSLAIAIGEWVIDTALAQMEIWQAAGLNIPVSVNIGSRQMQQPDFVERLRALLAAHPTVNPGNLQLEVLETSAMKDLTKVSRVIDACRKIGVGFALDDFGTGFSSLTYLKHLPVAQLKIDKSFVHDMVDNPDDLSIVDGVIGLASAFRLLVIAEGAETIEHSTILLQLGCDLAQGYGIARPMPASELPDWEAAWQPDPAWINLTSVSRDELPLLFASVEHRAWIIAMEKYLKGEREVPPPQDVHQCRFGQWLNTDGLARIGAQPSFEAVDLLHRKVHALATELYNLKAQGNKQEALARLGELHGLREALLEQLRLAQQSSQ